MKAVIFLILFFSAFYATSGQTVNLQVGGLYRITPVYLHNNSVYVARNRVRVEQDHQLITGGVSYGVEMLHDRIGVSAELLICHRYGYIHGKSRLSPMAGISENKSGFITDFSFRLKKYIHLFGNEFFFGVGHTIFNRGTDYTFTDVDSSYGQPIFITDSENLNFNAITLITGYRFKNRLSCEINTNYTSRHKYDNPSPFLLFELRVCYTIPLLKRKAQNNN